ncbi:MAG TPA: serine/threonine protein kinase, partial [Deltaproteobacteria bacterium]|nr:serine/threonine protein kinase [Deltaproteobacteria bacterium]
AAGVGCGGRGLRRAWAAAGVGCSGRGLRRAWAAAGVGCSGRGLQPGEIRICMLDEDLEVQLRRLAQTHGWSEEAVRDVRAWVADLLAVTGDPSDRETVFHATHLAHSGTDTSAPGVAIGGERFEIQTSLGQGAMGEVFRVWDRSLRRSMAMKTVRPERAEGSGVLDRFVAEAQLTSQLRHPAIVPVHELGRLPDGRLYYTMREIRGRTLGSVLRALHEASDGSWGTTADGWSLHRVISVFRSACEAVGHAHARGVVHRDLKPSNVMVGEFGEVQIIDWGIAKVIGVPEDPVQIDRQAKDADATRLGDVIGTPAYMAPEQAYGLNDRVDARTDVYALGAVLYEVLSGRPPYIPIAGRPVLAQVLEGPPPPLRGLQGLRGLGGSRAPGPPEALVELCEASMSRDRAERPADGQQLAQCLDDWLAPDARSSG